MQQPVLVGVKDKNHGLLVSPRFQMAQLQRLLKIKQDEIEQLCQKYKTNFTSIHVLLDSKKLPFLTSVVMEFLYSQALSQGTEFQKLVVLINKQGYKNNISCVYYFKLTLTIRASEVKMEQQDKENFKVQMMELRKALIKHKTKGPKDKLRILDEKLSTSQFQKHIFQKFYFMYLWRVAREERKVLEKSQDNLKKCFTIVSQVFKANIRILHYSEERGFRKTAEFICPSSAEGPEGTNIFLLYYNSIFIQLNT